jgi:dihydrolipoamide dehydrogenase
MIKVAIIGAGPGGYIAAIRAAQLGAEVTLIEKNVLGGTCLNVGCIPTKALLHSAGLFREMLRSKVIGITAKPEVDFGQVQANKKEIVNRLVSGVNSLMKANKVKVVHGSASFVNAHTLNISNDKAITEEITADKIIIATGSIPSIPPIPGLDLPVCIDSTGALSLKQIPESLLIIGGGVIGVEMASIYRAFGSQVTIVEMLSKILPAMDHEVVKQLRQRLEMDGVDIYTSAKVLSVAEENEKAVVHVEINGHEETFWADRVLVAIGRRANTAGLTLENAGVHAERGAIIVNDRMETNVSGIYAIGDCNGRSMLAHVASSQGEIAAENAMGGNSKYDGRTNPSCVYTEPELASVGLTEEQAKEKHIDYKTGIFPMTANGKALIMNGGEGMIKIIADAKYHEVLGMHIFGPRATDLIVEGALAIKLEATTEELISTIHAHPTLGEGLREAALAVERRSMHMINK